MKEKVKGEVVLTAVIVAPNDKTLAKFFTAFQTRSREMMTDLELDFPMVDLEIPERYKDKENHA